MKAGVFGADCGGPVTRLGLMLLAYPLGATTGASASRAVAECSEFRRPNFDAIRAHMKASPPLTAVSFKPNGIGRGAPPQRLPVALQALLPQAA